MQLVVGRVVKPHGLRGELVVDVRTDAPEQRFVPGALLGTRLRDGTVHTLTVAAARPHAGRLLVVFEGVAGRDRAEALRGAELTVDSASLPPIEEPDEYYDHQLEGLAAVRSDGAEVGIVREIVHGQAGDLLVIVRTDGGEVLVPFVAEIVPEVDLTGGRLVLDPPAGLLDELDEQ